MKYLIGAITAAVIVLAGVALAQTAAQPGLYTFPRDFNDSASRPPLYASGGWTTIDSDNSGANLSGELNAWTTYAIQCDDDAYIAWGGTAAAADSSDGWIAAGAWIRFTVGGADLYVSVLNKASATADCHYIEAR
jgi:hypothetical protein